METLNTQIIPELISSKNYTVPSGLGGTFKVKYFGEKEGKHIFWNVSNNDFKGAVYNVSENGLAEFFFG